MSTLIYINDVLNHKSVLFMYKVQALASLEIQIPPRFNMHLLINKWATVFIISNLAHH